MFEYLVRVRWRDTDALGHVNHAVFLTYLEEGRDAFYVQALGSDPHYVVARIELDLRAEVRHPDQQVTVRIQAERLGTTSLTTRETILAPSGQVAAQARVVTVRWDPGRRQPIPFSDTERTRLAAAMAGQPARELAGRHPRHAARPPAAVDTGSAGEDCHGRGTGSGPRLSDSLSSSVQRPLPPPRP
jgi:acyl-CoA thioester hydrolase